MSSAFVIGPFVLQLSLAVLFISFTLGFVFFWFMSPFTKDEKKKLLDQTFSYLIFFVISLWIGKIITHFNIFLYDPRAIIPYPSDSSAFYVAIIISVVYFIIKTVRNSESVTPLLLTMMFIFLSASFMYEFFYMIVGDSFNRWEHLALLLILLGAMTILLDRLSSLNLLIIILFSWSLGKLLITFLGNSNIFQFHLDPLFYGIILFLSILLIIYRKKVFRKWQM
ncbi:hypothetical protein ACLIA0_03410 [Bacillaceae bacterium W0354]